MLPMSRRGGRACPRLSWQGMMRIMLGALPCMRAAAVLASLRHGQGVDPWQARRWLRDG